MLNLLTVVYQLFICWNTFIQIISMTLVLGHQIQFTIKGIKFDMKFAVSALKLEFHSKTLQLTSNLFPNSTALKQQVIFDLPPLNLTRLSSEALIPLIMYNKLFEQITNILKKKLIFFHWNKAFPYLYSKIFGQTWKGNMVGRTNQLKFPLDI